MFQNIKVCSASGTRSNEDALLTGPSCLAVLDGATGLSKVHLTNATTDAQWFSQRIADLLGESLANTELELPAILYQAAETAKAELDKMGYRALQNVYPSASVSILRIRDRYLEGCVLGDCPILLGRRDGVQLIYDDAVAKRDAAVLNWMSETCRRQSISMAEARKFAEPLLQKKRQEMNQENSYWILEPTGAGIAHSMTFRCDLQDVKEAALLTDGFFAFYNSMHLTDSVQALLNSLRSLPLEAMLDRLRTAERADPDLTNSPRFKVSDDATAVYAAVSAP